MADNKENNSQNMADSVDTALRKVDLNAKDAAAVAAAATSETNKETTANSDPTACSFCKKSKATKRCSKRHAKCLKKIFCDSVCETQAHKKKVEAPNKEDSPPKDDEKLEKENGDDEKAAKAKKKKARKAANAGKKSNDGSFWWNNAVY